MQLETPGAGESAGDDGETRCAECDRVLVAGEDIEITDGGSFCLSCYEQLAAQISAAVNAQGQDINYSMAFVGAMLGGIVGAAVWWGFTVLTHISFGLVAVVIGIAVGKGIIMFSSGKRSQGLQGMAVAVAAVSFFYASYLVNRSLIIKTLRERGESVDLSLLPSLDTLYEVIALNFGLFDLVFLAIVVHQAWSISAPFKLRR